MDIGTDGHWALGNTRGTKVPLTSAYSAQSYVQILADFLKSELTSICNHTVI